MLRKYDEKPEVDAKRTEPLLIAHSFDVFLKISNKNAVHQMVLVFYISGPRKMEKMSFIICR